MEQVTRRGNAHLQHEVRLGAAEPLQQEGQFRSDDVVADAHHHAATLGLETAQCLFMGRKKGAGRPDEGLAIHREAHVPWGLLQKSPSQALFQTLDPQAYGRLRGVHCLMTY